MTIHPRLIPHVRAALEADIMAFYHRPDNRQVSYVYLTQPDAPGAVTMQVAQFPMANPEIDLHLQVRPHREYGNAVLVDYSGDPADLSDLVIEHIWRTSTPARFTDRPMTAKVDNRMLAPTVPITRTDLDRWDAA